MCYSPRSWINFYRLFLVVYVLFSGLPVFADEPDIIPFEPDDTLEEIQEKIEHNGYSFTVDHNWVFDMSQEEKARYFTRRKSTELKPYPMSKGLGPLEDKLGRQALPGSFDWRNYYDADLDATVSYIGPVRNQGGCGSCYSFGATAALEGAYNFVTKRYNDNAADFSEAFLAFCLSGYYDGFDGCDGADYEYEELDAISGFGLPAESAFPYTGNSMECDQSAWLASRQSIPDWYRIPSGDIEAIKTALSNFGVLDAAVMVDNAFQAYAGGVFENANTTCPDAEYTTTDHVISLVGWDDNPPEGGGGVWILRNSWGENWGENGYMRIRYTSAAVTCAATYLDSYIDDDLNQWVDLMTGDVSVIENASATLHATITPTVNASDIDWYFEYGEDIQNLQESDGGSVTSSQEFSVSETITGLSPGTQYYYRIRTLDSWGDVKSFSTDVSAPVVETLSAIEIDTESARLRATVQPGGVDAEYYFEYGETDSYGTSSTPVSLAAAADSAVDLLIENLHSASTYHFRIIATNQYGTSTGDDQIFTTSATPPIIQVNSVDNISDIKADVAITVTPLNSETIAFIEYGLTTDYGNYSAINNMGDGRTGVETVIELTDLLAASIYHYRLVGSNVAGMTYGSDQTFTTLAGAPYATTVAADELTTQGARINALVNPRNSDTTYYFEYGPTTSYGSVTTETSAGSAAVAGSVSETLENLDVATEYHYRVVATNVAGVTYGDDMSLTTLLSPPYIGINSVDASTRQTEITGVINGYGAQTSWYVEYGKTTAYGLRSDTEDAGSQYGQVDFEATLTSLDASTTYHYRVVATNSAGTQYSDDAVFETQKSSSKCFIATAAYGSPMEEHVQILRDFRDQYLLPYSLGRVIVDFYYRNSPPIADYIAQRPSLKQATRWILKPVVAMAWLVNTLGGTVSLLLMLSAIIATLYLIKALRHKIADFQGQPSM